MVAPNQSVGQSGGESEIAKAIASYRKLGDEFYDDSIKAEMCGCEKCKVMAKESACSMMLCGAAIHALQGNPAMLDEIRDFMVRMAEKYPSPNV